MYIATFYSFKGGVGRTMALVNVAVDLVQRGRRVLVVDFDLEAPGIDTFEFGRPDDATPGVIDFVSAYLNTGQAPDVSAFVFESPSVGNGDGELWIMPAGTHHDGYANTFAEIDWAALYEQHDGYLLFEDLKAQWKERVRPDYVLIDSRTGHTDVGGICTRQLPDAVITLFFPNAQNLRGLTKVVRDVRAEPADTRGHPIDLHFVMSNVPDLDDEDRILDANIAAFRRELGFRKDPMVIHRYDSLSLLNQVIFTKERPRSRLAREYQAVTAEIMRLNAADRDGALDYIARIGKTRGRAGGRAPADADKHLKAIEEKHSADGEVLFHLGGLRLDEGDFADAGMLLTRAIDAGYREPEVYLRRAFVRRSEQDRDGASADALQALESERASPGQVRQAISMVDPRELTRAADSPAVAAAPPGARIWIAGRLEWSADEVRTAFRILQPLIDDEDLEPDERGSARHQLSLAAIAMGRFSEAIEAIQSENPDVGRMRVFLAFNYGMALWGKSGRATPGPFQRVVDIESTEAERDPGPNYLQCLAVSHWAIGEPAAAREFAERARQAMAARRGLEFSCWRYLRVDGEQFADDIDEMLQLFDGDETVKPRFMRLDGEQHPLFEDRQSIR